jgi:hypothetical protein
MIDRPDITAETVDTLVSRYADAASAHQKASEQGDHKRANPQHDVVAAVYRELRRRGEAEALLPLLGHDDLGVRAWAGAHALEFAPPQGERVLEEISAVDGLVGFDAKMTLQTWREGELRFP